MSFLTFVAVGTIAGGAVSAFIWWALFTTKSTARADVAVVVYEPFRVIRASHPKLGAALREAESVENRDTNTWWLYLGKHQHAFVVWDRAFYQLGTDGQNNNRWFRVVDLMDQGVNQELAATYGDPRRLREHFRNVPNGLEPPYGGVGQGWDYSPDTWRWIGWRVWHFNVCGVMKQEFEGGRIYAPVPIHRGANQNAEAVVLLYDANSRDRGSWEYQDIRGMVAPRTRDPFESKPCWEN